MAVDASIEETVKKISERILRRKDITFSADTSFKDLGADSLDIVQILVAVEDMYDIELNDEDLQNISDTAGFIAYIKRKISEKDK